MRTSQHQRLQRALIMQDQKHRLTQPRRHEVNINEHCLDDFYDETSEPVMNAKLFMLGVAFGLCACVLALVLWAV